MIYIIMRVSIPNKNITELDTLRESMGFTWPGILHTLSQHADEISQTIKAKTKSEVTSQNTMKLKLSAWVENVKDNLTIINESEDITELPKLNDLDMSTPVLCLGAGPSLYANMDNIHRFEGIIITCERALIPLLKNGIIPHYVVSIDGSDIMTQFIDHPLVNKHAHRMTGVFSTTAAPSTVHRWPGRQVFFTAWLDDTNGDRSISNVLQIITTKTIMHTGGHCGATLWFLMKYLQANPIVMLGMDMAYPASIPDLSHTQIWPAICHLSEEEILTHFRRETNPFGEEIITDYAFDGFKETWLSWIRELAGSETIQCSDFTIMHQPPLKTMKFTEYLKRGV